MAISFATFKVSVSDASLIVNNSANNFNKTSGEFLVKILVEEIRLVFTFKDEFGYENKSIQAVRFGFFGLSKIWTREQNDLSSKNSFWISFL